MLSYLVLRARSWLALCIFFSLPAHLSKLDLKAILFVNKQSLKNQTIELRSTFLHNLKLDGKCRALYRFFCHIFRFSPFIHFFRHVNLKPSKRGDLVFYLIVVYISSILIALLYRLFSIAHSIIRVTFINQESFEKVN